MRLTVVVWLQVNVLGDNSTATLAAQCMLLVCPLAILVAMAATVRGGGNSTTRTTPHHIVHCRSSHHQMPWCGTEKQSGAQGCHNHLVAATQVLGWLRDLTCEWPVSFSLMLPHRISHAARRAFSCSWETDTPLLSLRVTKTKAEVLAALAEYDPPDSSATSVSAPNNASQFLTLHGSVEQEQPRREGVTAGGGLILTPRSPAEVSQPPLQPRALRHPLGPPNSRNEAVVAGQPTQGGQAADAVDTQAGPQGGVRTTGAKKRGPVRRRKRARHMFDAGPNTVMFHRAREAAWHELQEDVTGEDEAVSDSTTDSDSDEIPGTRDRSYFGGGRIESGAAYTPSALGVEWNRAYDMRGTTPLTLHATVVGDAGISQLCDLTNAGLSSNEQVFRYAAAALSVVAARAEAGKCVCGPGWSST